MRVLVLGAGVIGTACAHYLVDAGHEVVVVDRRSGPARETSFANAGGVCPSFAGPWAAPGVPRKILDWMFTGDAPISLRPTFDWHQWRWLAFFIRNCSAERFARNKMRMQRIAHYSKACLVALREETGIAYDHASNGVLQIFQTEAEANSGEAVARMLRSMGVLHRLLNRNDVQTIEPALADSAVSIAGGLHLPGDETGDCHLFTVGLADALQERGVVFQFDTIIERLLVDEHKFHGAMTSRGLLRADIAVVALASEAPFLLRPLGLDIPVYPVKGYALTASITRKDSAPSSSVMDEHSKLMVTRLGDRIRAAGIAEIGGYDRDIDPRRSAIVLRRVKALFPDAADYGRAEYWTGLRPMTPDGPPYLGRTPIANLILNVGQGSNGWTQACGCGRIVADIVSGRQPEIDLDGFGFVR